MEVGSRLEEEYGHLVLEVPLEDGSTFILRGVHVHALNIKYSDLPEDILIDCIRTEIGRHWEEKTVPNRYNEPVDWEEFDWENWSGGKPDFKTMSSIGDIVIYPIIRAPLMGVLLSFLGGGGVLTTDGSKYTKDGRENVDLGEVLRRQDKTQG